MGSSALHVGASHAEIGCGRRELAGRLLRTVNRPRATKRPPKRRSTSDCPDGSVERSALGRVLPRSMVQTVGSGEAAACSHDPAEPRTFYGVARLPTDRAVVCSTPIVREIDDGLRRPHDWIDLSLPLGALGRVDARIGGNPFGDEERSLDWPAPSTNGCPVWLVGSSTLPRSELA